MEKLELKHLAGYLPYGVKCICESTNHKEDNFTFVLDEISNTNGIFASYEWYSLSGGCIKPILRNLSDLTKEIEVNGEKFVPIDKIAIYSSEYYLIEQIKIGMVEVIVWEMLLKWHFALNIPEHLYIDINTL